MKQGVSTLNPYAALYIPLSKRDPGDKTEVLGVTVKMSASGNQTGWCGHTDHAAQNGQHDKASSFPEGGTGKRRSAHGFYGSSSQHPNQMTEKQMADEEFDMDMEYLQMTFPGLSVESLADVHMANKGDLEATVDMLNQLEFDTLETSENLPETLDIGDVSEAGSSAECTSVKQKNVVDEAGTSASHSLASSSVTVA